MRYSFGIVRAGAIAAAISVLPTLSAAAGIESFTPQGTVKGVRQVTARFTEPMVPFGDPRLVEPFNIQCPEKGSGRWVDSRNWAYDFEHDLPAGVKCVFTPKRGLQTMAGEPVKGGDAYAFSTGGPSVLRSMPQEGNEDIDEDQIFILGLDAPADPSTIEQYAYCEASGSSERIGVRLIEGAARKALLDRRRDFVENYFNVLFKTHSGRLLFAARLEGRGSAADRLARIRDGKDSPIAVLQCKLRLPNSSAMSLVWGAGIRSRSGIATDAPQPLAFRTRPPFSAKFSCERANKKAGCIPVLPMSLDFSAPVSRALASQITLQSEKGLLYRPQLPKDAPGDDIDSVTFNPPFPPRTRFTLSLPSDIRDDAGRLLSNAAHFPLKTATDDSPPIVKFAARFGVVESRAGALLPVTVRNVEASLAGRQWSGPAAGADATPVPGRVLTVNDQDPAGMVSWLRRLKETEGWLWAYDADEEDHRPGARSVFSATDRTDSIAVPKATSRKTFEVIGIPLKQPGFYVVELSSPRLGAALLGEKRPYYVQAAALVTNLSVHFKLGRESSLAWVTSLDGGKPVPGADVAVLDCQGKSYWSGRTDASGIAHIETVLPNVISLPSCLSKGDREYLVTARVPGDMSFVMSEWNEGIAPWRFGLQQDNGDSGGLFTTVFDRTLLRAGETVHMKHLARVHTRGGFVLPPPRDLPAIVEIEHMGSEQKYTLPLTWENGNAEGEWKIPDDAKQGMYSVTLKIGTREYVSGSFRVEAFRVPTMKAMLTPAAAPLVDARTASLNVQLNYLSGGGAGNARVKLRAQVMPRTAIFRDFDGYTFGNGDVKAGVQDDRDSPWYNGQYALDDPDEDGEDEPAAPSGDNVSTLATRETRLDAGGGARITLEGLPAADAPRDLLAELEYQDANGETLTSSAHVPLWPSRVVVGIKPDSWVSSRNKVKFKAVVVDLEGKPVPGAAVTADLFKRESFSHRKRLNGGFYAYENYTETKRLGGACSGRTDSRGLLVCDITTQASGNLIVRVRAADASGRPSYAHDDIWVAGAGEWWFPTGDSDRIDVLPERKRYEPGETASFQVRMPFRTGTALVTVEREGIIDSFVQPLSGRNPVVRVPIKGNYAPNVYVSVFVVRGRAAGVQPTALVDLGKPAFKLGIADINVGWRAHELKVSLAADKPVYKVRQQARISISARRADGAMPPAGTEVAIAAVDEGLLELMPNDSWKLLESMMGHRGIAVETSTAQMQVIGKRHYGRKALPQGGGGGHQTARELFDTLLFWKARVTLDGEGKAEVSIPLNDSLTSFRVVAVADAGADLFGTGETSIRSTQDIILLSGLPPLVREQDRFAATFTVRNSSDHALTLRVEPHLKADAAARNVAARTVTLAAGEASDLTWEVTVPVDAHTLSWDVSANAADGSAPGDRVKIVQQVIPAVAVRTFQATIAQLDHPLSLPVRIPGDAIPGRGGIGVTVRARLGDELAGVREYMTFYPYTCLEQRVSQAVSLDDDARWNAVTAILPSYLDNDGLAKYFPIMHYGSDVLTSYLLAVSAEAGRDIPDDAKKQMMDGLLKFVQGRVLRGSDLPTADLAVRKIAALDALLRWDPETDVGALDSITIEPNLWPTSAVLDWYDLLKRSTHVERRDERMAEAEGIIRSRLNLQGTTMGFSTERTDAWWWLMLSGDVNANRVLLEFMDNDRWREDMPRLVRGAVGRQQHGRWVTTVANAWGALALQKFSARFEREPVTGKTLAALGDTRRELEPAREGKTDSTLLPWPAGESRLDVQHTGGGAPWVTVQSLAAIPLKNAFSSGYRIVRSVTPVQQRTAGTWSRGDILRVHLDLEAPSDMTWVVVRDPIPSGSTILGTGLGGDSAMATRGEKRQGWVWPAFEERTFESFRAYYRLVPKGKWSVEYTVRLNTPGHFELPETRVEAMYSPEMFGEIPNPALDIAP